MPSPVASLCPGTFVIKRILKHLDDALAVMGPPAKYRRRLWTSNSIERLNQEIRRRERAKRIFPNQASALRLIRKGVSPGAAIAYMLAGPTINPIVALSTLVAYRFSWKIMALRIIGGYTIAGIVALIVQKCAGDTLLRTDIIPQKSYSLMNISEFGTRWSRVIQTAAGDFIMAGKYLVMGAFLAGFLQSIVSRNIIAGVIASPIISILTMMGLAVCLSICSDGDAFVAPSFGKNAFPLSSQMSFMLIGPMMDIKLMLMYRIVFRKRAIPTIAISVITVVLCVSYLLHLLGPVFI